MAEPSSVQYLKIFINPRMLLTFWNLVSVFFELKVIAEQHTQVFFYFCYGMYLSFILIVKNN